nr:hypothetical protein Pyn_06004 [Ipomoea batatas]
MRARKQHVYDYRENIIYVEDGLLALVSTRDILAAVIEQQAEGDGNVEVDSEDVGFNGGAEAGGGFEVDKTADERAARGGGGASDNKVKQVSQKVFRPSNDIAPSPPSLPSTVHDNASLIYLLRQPTSLLHPLFLSSSSHSAPLTATLTEAGLPAFNSSRASFFMFDLVASLAEIPPPPPTCVEAAESSPLVSLFLDS